MVRAEIEERYKWDLTKIVNGDEEWKKLFDDVSGRYKKLLDFKGRLTDAETVLECLNCDYEISSDLERLYTYAQMKQDEDASLSEYQAMTNKANMLAVEISSATSFITPELTALSDSVLEEMAARKEFADYTYLLKGIIRNKRHVLSAAEERILSEAGSFSENFREAFNMFDNADIKFEPVKDANGKQIELTHGVYGLCLQSADRTLRENAFRSMFTAYKGMINTVTKLYSGNVKKNVFYAKMRKFDSALERAVFAENVPIDVHNNLIECVHKCLPVLHEYMGYRKKQLGVNLHMWDMHTPITEGMSLELEYEDACKLVKEALKPLGEEYGKLLDRAFNERWIDVYESKGKRSGAYSWGCYNSPPYVLLNYQKTTHDVFTIAHELGHSMHSYYSNTSQPYAKAGYEIFVAEVASTVNEVLLLKYLLGKADDKAKKYLLSYYMDMFRTTFFRQTQFAEFESKAHSAAESGEALTPETLNKIYYELNKEYYGDNVESDELIAYEWARIPHFYRSFYVYKYATGITSAVVIADRILKEGDNAVKEYKRFLSTGGSMPPAEELKIAGVDLTSEEPFDICESELKATLEELKKLD